MGKKEQKTMLPKTYYEDTIGIDCTPYLDVVR